MQFISSVVLISASIRHERSQREKKIISEVLDAWQQPWLISSKVDTGWNWEQTLSKIFALEHEKNI